MKELILTIVFYQAVGFAVLIGVVSLVSGASPAGAFLRASAALIVLSLIGWAIHVLLAPPARPESTPTMTLVPGAQPLRGTHVDFTADDARPGPTAQNQPST